MNVIQFSNEENGRVCSIWIVHPSGVVGDCEIVPAGQYVRLYVMEEHHGIGSFLSPKVIWIKLDLKCPFPQDITINQVE